MARFHGQLLKHARDARADTQLLHLLVLQIGQARASIHLGLLHAKLRRDGIPNASTCCSAISFCFASSSACTCEVFSTTSAARPLSNSSLFVSACSFAWWI